MKKVWVVMLLGYSLLPSISLAAADYAPLTTIPGVFDECKDGNSSNPNCAKADPVKVIKNIYGISIGIAAVLAVIMVIFAGIEYATVESITGKSDAKNRWQGALWGLLLLLGSYLILRTINVDLVNINLDLGAPVTGSAVSADPLKDIITNVTATAAKATEDLNKTNYELRNQQVLLEAAKQDVPPDTKKIADLEAQVAATQAIQQQKAVVATKSTDILSATRVISTNLTAFDAAVNENGLRIDIAADNGQKVLEKYTTSALKGIDALRNKKSEDGKNLYTPQEITTISQEFAKQLNYMKAYVAWQNEKYSNPDKAGAAPTKPAISNCVLTTAGC